VSAAIGQKEAEAMAATGGFDPSRGPRAPWRARRS
jgi:hypothetical protein